MEATKTLTTNRIYGAEGCKNLPVTVHKIGNDVYTEACFELTPNEISQIIATRKIYYSVLGDTIIPMMLHTESYVEEKKLGEVKNNESMENE